MNEASRWRLDLAQQIAPLYETSSGAQAVIVGGSVSRNCADRYSDIELGIFWTTPPTEKVREEIARRAGGRLYRSFGLEQEAWSEEYYVHGVKLDVHHQAVSSMQRCLSDVIDGFETDERKQILISTLNYAVPLSGALLLNEWQAKLKPYPRGLAEAMVRQHLMLGPQVWLEILAERNSVIELYSLLCTIQRRLLSVLMGLNRVYHPGFKWLDRLFADLPLAPHDFGERLRQVFRLAPCESVRQIGRLIEETYQLVEQQMPSVETGPARARLKQTRPIWDHSPLPEPTGNVS